MDATETAVAAPPRRIPAWRFPHDACPDAVLHMLDSIIADVTPRILKRAEAVHLQCEVITSDSGTDVMLVIPPDTPESTVQFFAPALAQACVEEFLDAMARAHVASGIA